MKKQVKAWGSLWHFFRAETSENRIWGWSASQPASQLWAEPEPISTDVNIWANLSAPGPAGCERAVCMFANWTRRGSQERDRSRGREPGARKWAGPQSQSKTEASDVRDGGKNPNFGVPERSGESGSAVCRQSENKTDVCVASLKLEFLFNWTSKGTNGVAWLIVPPSLSSVFRLIFTSVNKEEWDVLQ